MEEKCLYSQGAERCCDVLASVAWHKWQSSSPSAATCLEHSLLHGCLCCQPLARGMRQLVLLKLLARCKTMVKQTQA